MSQEKIRKPYPDNSKLYLRKEANRKKEAKRPVAEKMAAVERLRDFERKLAHLREANRAKRAAKQIKISIKVG